MEKLGLEISLADGQTLHAQPRPADARQLADLLSDRPTVQFAASDGDVEGHTISTDVFVDVEGHAIALRLPTATDAAALRRALAVGALTATVVGAGVIAGLQAPPQTRTPAAQAPAAERVQQIPAQAMRAQRDETLRQQNLQVVPADANNPAVPSQALRAEQAELQREQSLAGTNQAETLLQQVVPADANNPAVPRQALRAEQAELQREQSLADENR